MLLVGDWAQLQSVDAGGAFPLLAEARDDTPELTEVHRFVNEWEKDASVDLRLGRTKVISTYFRHERVKDGTHAEMVDAAYLAWRADLRAGRSSLLVTESTDAMVELNERARAERLRDGETLPSREVGLQDGTRASVGDLIITRQNHRRIHALRGGWVKNGDRWRVTDVNDDGSVVVQRLGMRFGGSVVLPADYVAEHVDLGYAITAHRAQGMTVDTAHVVVTGSTTRENFYVAMTRGRESNIAYVALDRPDDSHAAPSPEEVTAKTILFGVLQHSGVELSAHQTIKEEQEHWSSFKQIVGEYLTIAAVAQRDRWVAELSAVGPVGRADRRRDRVGLVRAARRRASPRRVEWRRHLRCAAEGGRPARVRRRRGHRRRPHQPRPPRHIGPGKRRSTPAEADRRPRPGRRRADVEQDASSAYRASGPARVTGDRARRSGCRRASGLGPPTRRTTRRLSAA